MIKLLSFMFILTNATFAIEYDLPSSLKRLGLANPKDFDACRTLNHPHPILSYHLDMASIEEMKVQYQVALQAKKENRNAIALKVLWDLAERGYAPANDDLADIFLHGSLGVEQNSEIARIFLNRPYTIESMLKMQNSVRYNWENYQLIHEKIGIARAFLDASCRESNMRKGNNDDASSDTTARDSGSSTESFHLEITEGDFHSNPLLTSQQTAFKKKDD
jgi:hypothetical protein